MSKKKKGREAFQPAPVMDMSMGPNPDEKETMFHQHADKLHP